MFENTWSVKVMNVDPNLTKYLIKAKIWTDGVVEKPDVVGAIFGQTEGLLGDELDLRDLQKTGKIGRIEVEIESKKGKTEGTVFIPSGMDQVESSILAASLETIDRIGPCKAKLEIESVEDVRVQRRAKIIERAQALYKKMNQESKSVSEGIVQAVREEVEKGEIISYGDEKLPAGPAIKDSDSIIVVEGRSDVLNLLKYGIKNTIAVQGTNVPKTVQDLSKERTVIVFLDGDRGGDLILKEMLQVMDIDFVARAPPGTEVEELTYKQIVKALRYKTPLAQYLSMRGMTEELKSFNERSDNARKNAISTDQEQEVTKHPQHHEKHETQVVETPEENGQKGESEEKSPAFSLKDYRSVERKIEQLLKEKMTEVYSESGEVIASFPVSDTFEGLSGIHEGNTVITGGVITQRLIDVAHNLGIKAIYGAKIAQVTKKPSDIRVVPWDRHT